MSVSEAVSDYTAILGYLDDRSWRWNALTEVGSPVIVTYSFLGSEELPDGSQGFFGVDAFAAFTEKQQIYARAALQTAADTAGIIFLEVSDGRAMLNLYSGLDTDGGGIFAAGYAEAGRGMRDATIAADLVMIYQDFNPGSYAYQVLLHELGHTLGLTHPHEGALTLTHSEDYNLNTIMTYVPSAIPQDDYGQMDKKALAHIYGDASAMAGVEARIIHDGSLLVLGTHSADVLIAANIDTRLMGRIGDDTLFGREGDDTLHGGRGFDHLQGGMGDDKLIGWHGNDVLYGERPGSFIGGDDLLFGGTGFDLLLGGGGDDTIYGGRGRDTLYGGEGDDILIGNEGNDFIGSSGGNDTMTGGVGTDTFFFNFMDYGSTNIITDFKRIELIDLSDLWDESLATVSIRQVGADTEISVWNYDLTIRLLEFDRTLLTQENFLFSEGF